MPLFEYECEECGEKVEVVQKQNSDPPEHCGKPMKRIISGGQGFIFKGTGFYKTDYPKQKSK